MGDDLETKATRVATPTIERGLAVRFSQSLRRASDAERV